MAVVLPSGITCQVNHRYRGCRTNAIKQNNGVVTNLLGKEIYRQTINRGLHLSSFPSRRQVRGRQQRRRWRIACWFMEVKNVLVLFGLLCGDDALYLNWLVKASSSFLSWSRMVLTCSVMSSKLCPRTLSRNLLTLCRRSSLLCKISSKYWSRSEVL